MAGARHARNADQVKLPIHHSRIWPSGWVAHNEVGFNQMSHMRLSLSHIVLFKRNAVLPVWLEMDPPDAARLDNRNRPPG